MGLKELSDVEFQRRITARRVARMNKIDQLPPEIRELVHDYGYSCVKTLMDVGIKRPNQIRHVVETILNEFSPTRGGYSSQGTRSTPPGWEG